LSFELRRSQVIANATAAAATITTANAAVSTEIQVATLRNIQSRRAPKAPWRGGTVGIAGREAEDIGGSPYSEAAARNPAMTMVKATANQMSSTGTVIMGGGLGLRGGMELPL
jgi:hypothetical protein